LAGLILNVPYGSPFLPRAIQKRLTLTEEETRWENWRLTDPFLLNLVKEASQPASPALSPSLRRLEENSSARSANWPNLKLISYPFSPLVADPLGSLAQELGQIAVPSPTILTRGALQKDLPEWTASEKEFIFAHCVNPYLEQLSQAANNLLAEESLVLILTIRFFAAKANIMDHKANPKPQINLGFDERHTPKGLLHLAGHVFKRFGLWSELDYPLVGAPIPEALKKHARLKALGLAIRRDLYLDETKASLLGSASSLVRVLRSFFSLLGQELDRVARLRFRRAFPPKPPSSVIKADKVQKALTS
jgi:hypothetical protein